MTSTDKTSPLPRPTLVLGGTGKTGRRVAARLAALGRPVRVASRAGSPAFDWDDESTWAAALGGVGSIYLAYYPDLAVPGAADQIGRLARRAVAAGVERIVLLSGRGEPQVFPAEEAVRASGAAWTILRAAFFAQNFSEGFLADQVVAGAVAFPAGDVAEPFLDVDDLAEIAVLALTTGEHDGRVLELTGPRLVGFGEAAAAVGRAAGREVVYLPVSHEAYRGALLELMPPAIAGFLSDLFRHVLDGHNAFVTDDVERALGRPARDFTTYARDAAAAGAWR